MKVCSVEGCNEKHSCKGFCKVHYARMRRNGNVDELKKIYNRNLQSCTFPGCDKKHDAMGFCSMHYNRYKRNGNPSGVRTPNGLAMKWILEHIDYSGDDCLIWPYGKESYGYGTVQYKGKNHCVHSVIADILYGTRPDNYDVAHSCGMGHLGCVNPKHLSYKTRKENCDDTLKHGTRPMGEKHWSSMLTEADVLEIVKDTRTNPVIAKDYNVTRSTIICIKTGRSWGWLTGIKPKGTQEPL